MTSQPLRPSTLPTVTVVLGLLLAACGGGGGGGGDSKDSVTLTYPSGRIMAQGDYAPGTTTRTGVWKEYFDQDGSPQQWRRTYVDGTWDHARDWREWNADGSIRNDGADH
jgi:hypothetical protein